MTVAILNHSQHSKSSDGFIIVTVLWILGALATLVSVYAVYVLDSAAAFVAPEDRLRSEALVSAAIELTAFRLTAPAESRPTLGRFSFRLGQATVAVEFRSEAARIDINAAPKELLSNLFAVLGTNPRDADSYANRIVGWRTAPSPGQDTERLAYHAAGRQYAPRGSRFPHISELSLLLGLEPHVVERALPFLTVYSGRPEINVREAAPEVLAALPGMTRDRLSTVLAQRRATPGDGQILIQHLGPAQTFATLEPSRASRITVRVSFDNGRRRDMEVVILMFEEGEEPFSILSWVEDLDQKQQHPLYNATQRLTDLQ